MDDTLSSKEGDQQTPKVDFEHLEESFRYADKHHALLEDVKDRLKNFRKEQTKCSRYPCSKPSSYVQPDWKYLCVDHYESRRYDQPAVSIPDKIDELIRRVKTTFFNIVDFHAKIQKLDYEDRLISEEYLQECQREFKDACEKCIINNRMGKLSEFEKAFSTIAHKV